MTFYSLILIVFAGTWAILLCVPDAAPKRNLSSTCSEIAPDSMAYGITGTCQPFSSPKMTSSNGLNEMPNKSMAWIFSPFSGIFGKPETMQSSKIQICQLMS